MVQYICDMCGKTLDIDKTLVNLDFNSYATAGCALMSKTDGKKPEFQLCVECAYSVYRHIKKSGQRLSSEDKSKGDENEKKDDL